MVLSLLIIVEMKIHLPPTLRSALLACMTVFSPLSITLTTATLALVATTPRSHALEYTVSSYADRSDFAAATADDIVIVNLDGTGNSYLGATFESNAATIRIDNWTINNGNSNARFVFNSTITGSGDIVDAWSKNGLNEYYFTGNMSQYSGDILAGDTLGLNFGGHDDLTTSTAGTGSVFSSAVEVATSGNNGLGSASGTGAISNSYSYGITYNFTQAASVLNSSITMTGSGSLSFLGGANYALKSDVSLAGQLVIADGSSVQFSADALGNHSLSAGSMSLGDNSHLIIDAQQDASISGTISLGSGASISNAGNLSLNGAITLTGTEQTSIINTGSLSLGTGASITVGEGQSLYLSGQVLISAAGQIINDGSLSLGDDFVLDVSQMSYNEWAYDDVTGKMSFQIVAGAYGLGSATMGADQIVGLDSNIFTNVTVGQDGYLRFDFVDGTAIYHGGALTWTAGEGGFVGADGVTEQVFQNGANVFFNTGAATVTLGSDVSAAAVFISDAVSLTLSGGAFDLDCAQMTLMGSASLILKDDALSAASLISGNSSTSSTIQFNAIDASTLFDYGSQLKDYQGSLNITSGVVSLSHGDGFVFKDISITGNGASLIFDSNASFERLLVTDSTGITTAQISLANQVKVTIAGGANSTGDGSYYRGLKKETGSKAGYTINLGSGAVLSDNVRLWQGQEAINIVGQGRYELTSLLMGYSGVTKTVQLNVGAGASFAILGEFEATNHTNSFAMGGAGTVTTEVNIEGTFIINSQITHSAGVAASINVKDGGTFVLNTGLRAVNYQDDASKLSINVAVGGELQVGNQGADHTDYSSEMLVAMASGSTLASNGVDALTSIYHSIAFEQDGTHNLKASQGKHLHMNRAVDNAGTVNLVGGGTFSLAQSNDIEELYIMEKSCLKLNAGVSLFATGGSLNVGSQSSLDMSAGGGIISGSVQLADQSSLLYSSKVIWSSSGAGASIGAGYELGLDAGASFVVGFDERVVGSFEQVLFTDLTEEQLKGLGMTENYYEGMLGGLAEDILSADSSWRLAADSVVYLNGDGNLILKNLAEVTYWNDSGDGIWNNSNKNFITAGESGTYHVSEEICFGADEHLNKNVTVEGIVTAVRMDVKGDYQFSGGHIMVDYALNVVDGAQVHIMSELTLDHANLNIGENSSLTMSDTTLRLNLDNSQFFNDAASPIINMGEQASFSMQGGQLIIGDASSGATGSLDISSFDGHILVLAKDEQVDLDGVSISFAGGVVEKYFTDAYLEGGVIKGSINMNSYNSMALTDNGAAGLNMMSKALIELNPQLEQTMARSVSQESALASVLDSLDEYKAAANASAADTLGSAIAGASTTTLAPALMSDIQRQLGSIRNRTRAMGVDPSHVNHDMPYINAWMSGEGASAHLSSDGTAAGYSMTSMGASLGVDFDFTESLSVGLAYSYMRGDLSSTAADSASGDLKTSYGSLYARVNHKRWSHSLVASFGTSDITLDRSIATSNGAVYASGSTSGSSMGLMYELGYSYALNEDASSCIQPLLNISYLKSQVDAYHETGSDIALAISEQSLNTLSMGAGALFEAIVGENVYNRASVFSARAMLKYDIGDRGSEADVTLIANNGVTEHIVGAEFGAIGLELGVGLSIPVTDSSGTIFIDANCELRSGQNSFSGTVGYRFSF